MSGSILITDSLFIGPSHVSTLEAAGFAVERLDVPKASEAELVAAVRGKVGYILGGIETVTEPVISAADELKVISFTGAGYSEFIPAHEAATAKGIAITAAKGGNAQSVAEFTVAQILATARQIPALTQKGGKDFLLGRELSGLTVGVVGLGAIGTKVARLCATLGFRVLGSSRQPKPATDALSVVDLETLLRESDVVTLHVDKTHGYRVLGPEEIAKLQIGAGLVNCAFPDAIDSHALFERIKAGELRVIYDAPPETVPDGLPPGSFVASNAQTAFNTAEGNERVSDIVVESLLNVLETGTDKYVVNPRFAAPT